MFNLRVQVFVAFLSFIVLLIGGLFLYSKLSFERGFTHYIEQKETARNAKLITALETHFQLHNNWDNFKNNKRYWFIFVMQYTPNLRRTINPPIPLLSDLIPEGAELDEDYPTSDTLLKLPPMQQLLDRNRAHIEDHYRERWSGANSFLRHEPRLRFILLDSNKKMVAGKKWRNEKYLYSDLKIIHNNNVEIIGYLGTPMNPALRDLRDNEFAKRQQGQFLLMTLVALGIAVIYAIPLSYVLTSRVKKLARHVQLLSQGRYAERIASGGHDEISTLAEHLNHLAHTLEQSEKARKRWVADISHELRTPLAVLQADLEALEDGVRRFDAKALTRLQKHASRLTRLINDLYELSLTDIGAMSYRKQTCDIAELLGDLCVSLEGKFIQAGLQLELDMRDEPVHLLADAQRLQQLFLNLLNNSMNYTHTPGIVKITLEKNHTHVLIIIEDTAPGVDTALHEKLFERLYRAESSRSRETGGAGLGLSICRNIVTAHNGTINITHSELGGLKVSIHLPFSQE